ncbi:ATP-NAD kinase family protein [Paraperlucidibaca sp.]|uniref:ATP-NAD kinase family protein n=1 Tax=Paraperlucidibaca sp. TaxID=2708021 RepID=UPI0030F3BFA2
MKSFQTVSETTTSRALRIGLLINPYAGVGGPLALKGSDEIPADVRAQLVTQTLAGESPAQCRVLAFFTALDEMLQEDLVKPHWVSIDGPMGGSTLSQLGLAYEPVPIVINQPSTAQDTQVLAQAIKAAGVDLLLFAGGDGTARDVCTAIGTTTPVLGLPAGVKMHSGVFAINPKAAAELLLALLRGEWVALDTAEVRDIDETALRNGRVIAKHFGEMRVPVAANQLQQVKCSGLEVEALVVAEIAASVVEDMLPGQYYALGPGTTVAAVAEALALPNTLLGFDIICDGELVCADATAADLLRVAEQDSLIIIITPTGGQGSLIGRGNQQLSAALLEIIGRDALRVLATPAKLAALSGRPLRLDTNNANLDRAWSGLWPIITGYQQAALYVVAG